MLEQIFGVVIGLLLHILIGVFIVAGIAGFESSLVTGTSGGIKVDVVLSPSDRVLSFQIEYEELVWIEIIEHSFLDDRLGLDI